jgi:signal transduction histidine kinase
MKNKKINNRYLYTVSGILCAAAVLTMGGFAHVAKELEGNQAMVLTFRNFQQLNHNRNESMLRARSFLLESYDSLVTNVEQAKALCANITELNSAFMSAKSEALGIAATSYCGIVTENANLVEKFKSKNSILRNSIQYLPTLVQDFDGTPLENKAKGLLIETLRYAANPTADLRESLTAKTDPNPSQELLKHLFFHVRLVLRSTDERTEIESEILSSKIDTALSAFETIYQDAHVEEERKLNRFYFGLCSLCFVLGLGVFLTVRKLQRTLLQINDFNDSLESKVEIRTAELTKALSEIEEKQHMLLQTTKLSVLGDLASGIAHEINNPLSIILLNAETLMDILAKQQDPTLLAPLESIVFTVERISKIVTGLRRFTRDNSHDLKTAVPITKIIQDSLALCNQKFKKNHVDLRFQNKSDDLFTPCIPEQISQVLLNLLTNAVEAVSAQPPEHRWIQVETVSKGFALEVSVTDSGTGLTSAAREKLMQAFFTTKESGKGLGLSISKGIIEDHGGQLFYDETSKHTRFVIRLPQVQEQKQAA